MTNRILVLHGLGGSDYPHWQAQLSASLIKENNVISFPSFPNRNNPNLNEWKEYLKKEITHFKPNIIVCHSLANVLWFHICDEIDIALDKLLLVAPVSRSRVVEEAKTFYPYPIAKDLKSKEVLMLGSTNDPYMSEVELIDLKELLDVDIEIMKDAGHINASSGFGDYEFAQEWILKEGL